MDTENRSNIDEFENLPTEEEIESIANSRSGLLSYFKVARVEFPKFFLLGGMFGIIGFIYSFMRILKDMFIMTRQDQNTILFMKIFYILPVSTFLVFLIQYMMNTKSISKIFSIFVTVFAIIFFVFGCIFLVEEKIMPSRFFLRDFFVDGKAKSKGLNILKTMFLTINEPLATLIFITAEMWGSLLMAYLFMSFLNESCSVNQFSRFIPPLYIIANLALLTSALVTGRFLELRKKFDFETNQILCAVVFFVQGVLTLMLLFMKIYLANKVLSKPIFIPSSNIKKKKEKVKVGFMEGIETMKKSKLLLSMCLIVLFYNVAYNMIESTFKAGVKAASKKLELDIGNYSGNLNKFDQFLTSITVIVLNLSAFSGLVETGGWFLMGIITPVLIFMSMVIVLGSSIYNSGIEGISFGWISDLLTGQKPMYKLENYSGIFFLSLLKVSKYAAFDICKEKMGMRIDVAHRARFKSVYDGIFNKLGKSLGSLYGLLVLELFNTDNIRTASPLTFALIFVFVVIWFKCVGYLGGMYQKSVAENTNVDIDLFKKEKKNVEN